MGHLTEGEMLAAFRSRYPAVPIARLVTPVREAGFVDVARYDDVMFQRVPIGRRPLAA